MDWDWQTITASAVLAIASIDKIAMVALKSCRNIMDAWNETFHAGNNNTEQEKEQQQEQEEKRNE